MLARARIGRYERLLVERRVNQLKLIGPGLVWLIPGQRALALLNIGSQGRTFMFEEVLTVEKIPVKVKVQVIYRIDPALFTDDLLPTIPALNEGGWVNTMQQQTEYVVRQLLADYDWEDLGQSGIQQRLERHLTATVAERLRSIALNISTVSLIKITLPVGLQKTLVRAVQDRVEANGRAAVLKEYFDIFGHDLSQAMPYIAQWEVLNRLHKDGQLQLLASTTFPLAAPTPEVTASEPVFQMSLPVPKKKETEVKH